MKQRRYRVILESGLLSGPYSWAWVESRLDAKRYEALVSDRGATSAVDAVLREESYPAVLRRMLVQLGPVAPEDRFILVGHSVGGLLAQAHSRFFGAQAAGVVLVDPSPPEQFEPGSDPSHRYRYLNQTLLLRSLGSLLGRKLTATDTAGVCKLPTEARTEAMQTMKSPRFWFTGLSESVAAARHWTQAGFSSRAIAIPTAVVSSNVARNPSSLQGTFVSELLIAAELGREFVNPHANHESIVFDEAHSASINDAIDWVADTDTKGSESS